jgi:hypothetical protein
MSLDRTLPDVYLGLDLGRDGDNWIENGGIYYHNQTEKPAAKRLQYLWSKVWSTAVSITLPKTKKGRLDFRGFYGKYTYTAKYKTKVYR